MYLAETPDQQAMRKELREYFAAMLTPELRAAVGETGASPEPFREAIRKMGKDGWLGLGWPKEFGGQGRPATDQF